jgi:hypothetical protein
MCERRGAQAGVGQGATRILRWFAGMLLVFGLAACGTTDGKPGNVFGMFTWDATISNLDLSAMGLSAGFPVQLQSYQITPGSDGVVWTTVSGGQQYIVTVSVTANPGTPHKQTSCDIICTGSEDGSNGADKTYFLEFSNSSVLLSELNSTVQGAAF